MDEMTTIEQQLLEIKKQAYGFLKLQQSKENPTYFRYSLSGDLWGENKKWNVQGRVFALKIAYTIGLTVKEPLVQQALAGIKIFQHQDGYIYDDILLRKKERIRFMKSVLKINKPALVDHEYIRAESRQCYSALMMYNDIPDLIPVSEVRHGKEIDAFLSSLEWKKPWAAGSHFSHLMFFEKLAYENGVLNKEIFEENINRAYEWIKGLENPKTGSWHCGDVSAQQAINGAMKVITGLRTVNMTDVLTDKQCKKLIDLCLIHINDKQACDNFNIVYVLYYANIICPDYRKEEILNFAKERLHLYRNYYFPQYGGFSFQKGRSNIWYYGCNITKGKKEPDLHGTALFMWGLFFLSNILGVNESVGFREVVS